MTEYPVGSVKTAFDIVETLVDRDGAGVTEVAEAVEAPKSTAHDYLRTLEEVGYVVNESGTYRVSTRFLHVGKRARDSHPLFQNGRDQARVLFENTEQKHVQIAIEENRRCAVLLAMRWRHPDQTPQESSMVSTDLHLHTNAPGKAILAHWPQPHVEQLVEEIGLPRRTNETITDPERLSAALDRIRERGYAVDGGELITGMRGVAAPIVTDDDVHGAIAVYGPADRFPDDPTNAGLVAKVTDAARTVEANLIFTEA